MAAFVAVELSDPAGNGIGARLINIDAIVRVDFLNPNAKPEENEFRVTFSDGSTFDIRGKAARGFFEVLMKHHISNNG